MSKRKKKLIFTLAKFLFRANRSLNVCMVIMVFLNMMLAGILAFALIQAFRITGKFPRFFEAPLALMATFLTASVIIGTFISAIFTRSVLKPLTEMKEAMKRVEKGDFTARVSTEDTYGEVASLTESFNGMVQELNSIEMFREDFINSFSHEFKTPIVSIQGFAGQLKKENLSQQKRDEYIDIIISESKRLTNLSSNILMLNKLENQEIITDKTDFSLDEQLRSCILLLEKQWTQKNITFEPELEEITYNGNREMLSQAWLNILNNSIKFSPESSTIKVSLIRGNDRIRITFADSGEGMDESTLKHIFERFYQGDSAHSSEGNGLGLPLVKRIIELHGGTIRVESEKGKGTVFIVFLK